MSERFLFERYINIDRPTNKKVSNKNIIMLTFLEHSKDNYNNNYKWVDKNGPVVNSTVKLILLGII